MGHAPDWMRQSYGKVRKMADGGAVFDAESDGYDYDTAKRYGMGPDGTGENLGHWGSRVELNEKDRPKDLPEGTGIMLKGAKHETWDKALKGEDDAGYDVVKRGDRYYSIPRKR